MIFRVCYSFEILTPVSSLIPSQSQKTQKRWRRRLGCMWFLSISSYGIWSFSKKSMHELTAESKEYFEEYSSDSAKKVVFPSSAMESGTGCGSAWVGVWENCSPFLFGKVNVIYVEDCLAMPPKIVLPKFLHTSPPIISPDHPPISLQKKKLQRTHPLSAQTRTSTWWSSLHHLRGFRQRNIWWKINPWILSSYRISKFV